MALLQQLVAALRKQLVGPLFGDTYPPNRPPARSEQPVDARTGALKALKTYLTGVVYYLPQGEDKPLLPFQVEPDNFLIKAPDGEHAMKSPSIVVVGAPAKEEAHALTPTVLEETRDQFGKGTVLVWQHTYVETIALEVWASSEPMVRAVAAGLESGFSPIEGRAGLLLRCPDYYGTTARFLLTGRDNYNESDAGLNRRRAQFKVDLDINVVRLVRANPLIPQAEVDVTYGRPSPP